MSFGRERPGQRARREDGIDRDATGGQYGSGMEPSPSGSPWDRRVVRAMTSAESARQGATILRIVAAITAAVGIIGPVMYFTAARDDASGRIVWGQILQVTALPIAGAGVVLAFSFLVELYASRLDLDIVLADDDQTGGVDDDPVVPTQLPPPTPFR